MNSLNSEKAAKISAEEITRDNTIAQNNADLNTWASEQATTAWNAEQDRIEAQRKAEESRISAAQTAKSDLLQKLISTDYSDAQKIALVNYYAESYGEEGTLAANEIEDLLNTWGGLDGAKVVINEKGEPEVLTREERNARTYTKNYYKDAVVKEMRYHFVLGKNGAVTIYYPDVDNSKESSGIPVATVKITDLPALKIDDPKTDKINESENDNALQQIINSRTKGKSEGYSFYFTCDLSKLNL